ncbi:hypothetical protein L1987_18773 [Smallanthus sonchifolius]|uniref:Uncharacterized protein n=1 Tax=Smallanthus sonchifolius TaxID=185202 RepID=A0ACB9J2Q1_9ASTR|nr:hypothetical protein L1987_18773 [Smallanthus sonchifolius]
MASSSSKAQKRARLGEAQHEGDTVVGEGQTNAPSPPLHPHQLLSFAPGTPEHDRLARMRYPSPFSPPASAPSLRGRLTSALLRSSLWSGGRPLQTGSGA